MAVLFCSVHEINSILSAPGVGYATQVIVALLNIYYIIVLAWAIFFLSNSFTWDLPWASCNNTWNTGYTQYFITVAKDV